MWLNLWCDDEYDGERWWWEDTCSYIVISVTCPLPLKPTTNNIRASWLLWLFPFFIEMPTDNIKKGKGWWDIRICTIFHGSSSFHIFKSHTKQTYIHTKMFSFVLKQNVWVELIVVLETTWVSTTRRGIPVVVYCLEEYTKIL